MKKGYWIVAYRTISDGAAVREYSTLAGPTIQKMGGKPLARTEEAMEVFEQGLKQRTVLVEFESFEKAVAAYHSEAYQQALATLGSAAERDFRIVEGI